MAYPLSALTQPGGVLDWNGPLASYIKIGVGCLAASRLLFDSYYFLRVVCNSGVTFIRHFLGQLKNRKGLLEESITTTRCLTTDLDHMLHMNNSRYNRKCDFARYKLVTESDFYWVLRRHKKSFGLAATTIRFRKSINFLHSAVIKSKFAYWDERSFYVEQNFCRPSDSFVYATLYAKLTLLGTTSDQLLDWLGYTGPKPEPNADLKAWIEYNEESSKRLRPKDQ